MKKLFFFACIIIAIIQTVNAQTINVQGTIKDEKGIALPFVFVQEKQSKSAIYTDSLGNFNISVNSPSTLQFSLNGYGDTSIEFNTNTSLQVVLKYDESVKNNVSKNVRSSNTNVAVSDAFSGHTYLASANNAAYNEGSQMQFNGGTFPIAKEKEETHGSRYYYKGWANGYVINTEGKKINNAALLFNYNKVTGDLLLTHDQKTAIIVNRDQIKSFTLFDATNKEHIFKIIPAIDEVHFAEVLADGSKYKIYKLTKTKFIPANYTTNGLVSSGNSYDEYADGNTYYLVTANNQVQKLTLKRKAIKQAFENDENKVDTFFSKNNSGNIDDQFLKDLGDYMNQ
jgi:hypothetical protein